MRPGAVWDAVDQLRNRNKSDRNKDGINVDGDLWKLALYWATGKQFWSGSPLLTSNQATEMDKDRVDLPHIPCYQFVGSAHFEYIPGHVRRNAKVISRMGEKGPPPPGSVSPTTQAQD